MLCPTCGAEMRDMGPDELDQCGWTFLPAVRWECPPCCEAGLCTHVFIRTGEPYCIRKPPGSGHKE